MSIFLNSDQNFKNLLDKVSCLENLEQAFNECSRRKKKCCGYQNILPLKGERLLAIKESLLQQQYEW